jgi:hypothetical protein
MSGAEQAKAQWAGGGDWLKGFCETAKLAVLAQNSFAPFCASSDRIGCHV